METTIIVDTSNTEHYNWGNNYNRWHFVKSDSLSEIRETMAQAATGKLDYHKNLQQFFYILSGVATFEIDGAIYSRTNRQRYLDKTRSQAPDFKQLQF